MQAIETYILPKKLSAAHNSTERKTFLLHGLGGMGKTQLAVAFARKHCTEFSAVLWLDGSSVDRLKQSFVVVASEIPQDELTADITESLQAGDVDADLVVKGVLRWLSLPSNKHWLLIIDNIDRDWKAQDKDLLAYDLNEYLPQVDRGSVLLTSRLAGMLDMFEAELHVDRVDNAQARSILENTLGRELGDAQIIIDKLDRLPLALTQAGAYLRESNSIVLSCIENYNSTWKDLMEEQGRYPTRDFGDRGSILTTWMISYKLVVSESEGAANLLKLRGFLDHKDLWYGVVASVSNPRENDWVPKWLSVLAENEIKFNRAIRLLSRYSLIDVADQQTDSHAIHTVLHTWCHNLCVGEEQRSLLLLATMMVAQAVPAESEPSFWTSQRRLLPHAMHVYARMSGARRQYDWESHGKDEIPMWASHNLGYLFAAQVKFTEAEVMYKQASMGKEETFEVDHTSTLATVHNLGTLYKAQGKLEKAEEMYKRALAGKEKTLGADHTSILAIVNNLGNLYQNQGQLTEAEGMYKRALAGYEKAFGADHTSTFAIFNNLGNIYSNQGKLAEAEGLYKRALAGYEKAFGADHTSTLRTVNNLGNLYKAQDKLEKAEEMYKRALAGHERTFGADHMATLAIVNGLGKLHFNQGKLAEAEGMYKRALLGYEKALGAEHMSTLSTGTSLANLYRAKGNYADSEAMYKRELAGYEKAFGPDHMFTLCAVNDLGSLHRKRHYNHTLSIKRCRAQLPFFLVKNDTSSRLIIAVLRLWFSWGQARIKVSSHLGHMLLLEGNLRDAVVAFEQQIVRGHDGLSHSSVVCDGCGTSIPLPSIRYVCQSCEDVDLCPACHQNYELEGRLDNNMPICQDHDFLAVPRDDWLTLPSGAILADGTRIEEWMNRLLVSLGGTSCVEDLADSTKS